MHARGPPQGGGMGNPPPLPLPPQSPPQVLFFGEFTHQLAPGQGPKEGGDVDEVQ